jgi:UDP-N-acetylglucosamine 4,6-dehydratase
MSLLVTGAVGSLGRAILRAALVQGVDRLVAYDQDEFGGFMLREAFGDPPALRLIVGDVRDPEKLARAMHGVEQVIHCAARKWVATSVYNTDELVSVNFDGTRAVLEAARQAHVPQVLVVTSDKGVEPTNVYGASKFLAEQYTTYANSWLVPVGTRAACVRYGNLLWSRGSVAHRWKVAHDQRKPIRLTAHGMTRFGIRLSVAADLAIWAVRHLRGGEVFVPALRAYSLEDLARTIAPGTEFVVTGERGPGEKAHEVLLSEREAAQSVRLNWAGGPPLAILEPRHTSWSRQPWIGDACGPMVSSHAPPLEDLALDEMDGER